VRLFCWAQLRVCAVRSHSIPFLFASLWECAAAWCGGVGTVNVRRSRPVQCGCGLRNPNHNGLDVQKHFTDCFFVNRVSGRAPQAKQAHCDRPTHGERFGCDRGRTAAIATVTSVTDDSSCTIFASRRASSARSSPSVRCLSASAICSCLRRALFSACAAHDVTGRRMQENEQRARLWPHMAQHRMHSTQHATVRAVRCRYSTDRTCSSSI
jgi:hypothetical protein